MLRNYSYNFLLLFLILLFLFICSLIYSYSLLLIFLTLLLLCIVCAFGSNGTKKISIILTVSFINFIFVIIVYNYYLYSYGAPYYIGGSDDIAYENYAQLLINNQELFNFINSSVIPEWHNSKFYIFIIGIIMSLSENIDGYHTLLPRFLNSIMLSILSLIIYCFLTNVIKLKNSFKLIVVCIVFGLIPLNMYISSHIFRDVLVSLMVFHNFYLVVKNRKLKPVNIIFLIIYCSALSFLRVEAIIFLLFPYVYLIIKQINIKFKKSIILYLINIIIIFIFGLVYFSLNSEMVQQYYKSYSEYRLTLSDGGIGTIIFNLPLYIGVFIRPIYLYITPLPILTTDYLRLYLSIGTLILLLVTPKLITGFKLTFKKESLVNYMFVLIFITIALTTFTDRHMILYYPYLYIFICLYIFRKEINHE